MLKKLQMSAYIETQKLKPIVLSMTQWDTFIHLTAHTNTL